MSALHLPELEVVRWTLLDELRKQIGEASKVAFAEDRRVAELVERFDVEDAELEREVDAAVREGREPASCEPATPAVRRRAELRLARERLAEVGAALRGVTSRAARTVHERWDAEVDPAIAVAHEEAEYPAKRQAFDRDVAALTHLWQRVGDYLLVA